MLIAHCFFVLIHLVPFIASLHLMHFQNHMNDSVYKNLIISIQFDE